MTKVRAAIIEDEYPAVRLLQKLLNDLRPEWEVLALPGSIEGAGEWLSQNQHPDLIFLDIHLSDGNSFRLIHEANPQSVIIFITAYDHYALQAFSANSIDYLLKPVCRERLEEALCKFERLYQHHPQEYAELIDLNETLKAIARQEKKYRTRFLISLNNRLYTIEVDDIFYFYLEDRTVYAVTSKGDKHIVDVSLNQLEKELNPDRFCRVNRQFVLSVKCVRKIEPFFNGRYAIQIVPQCKEPVIVSREKVGLLKTWLSF